MVRAAFIIFLVLAGTDAQYGRGGPDHKGNDLDVNLDEPGEHDDDGLTLSSIPQTSFTCAGREPGYYADFETNCQVFRVCTLGSRTGFQSFICPSGTLFNQNVFVCDWASNVKCDKSKEVFTQERFGNLKLGPQIMQDVNKMLTHTMRVSYDENSAQINTSPQENKPPIEQASFNENSAAGPGYEQGPSNTYIPPQQTQNTFSNDVAFSASTASPQYTYNNPNSIQSVPKEPLKTNGRTGRYNNRAFQNNGLSQHTQTNRNRANQRNAFDRRRGRLIQNNQNSNTNTNGNGYPRISGNLKGEFPNKVKDNVVSNISPTIIKKTLTFDKIIQSPKTNEPKSRIVLKTWIVKPSRSAKSVADSTSYLYDKPIKPLNENVIVATNPYVYHKPTVPFSEDFITKNIETDSYIYKPTFTEKPILSTYPTKVYQLPTFVSPTTGRLVSSTTVSPSRFYLSATTYKPNAELYLPPVEATLPSRLYLPSNFVRENPNEKLLTAPSSTSSFIAKPNKNTVLQSQTKNLTYSDIFMKNNFDKTVKNIVNTSTKVLHNISPSHFKQQNQNKISERISKYENTQFKSDIEKLKKPSQFYLYKNSKIISSPSPDLQPPFRSDEFNSIIKNPLLSLPYFVKSTIPTTIERTISLKITIPEKIANYIFKDRNESSFDKLEILNTGESNYLVLVNNDKLEKGNNSNNVPIGKITLDNNQNSLSTSQALLYSFLSNSVNEAKEFSNVAQQNARLQSSQQSNKHNKDSLHFTNQVSRLTSSQYSGNNNNGYNYNNPPQRGANSQSSGASSYTKNTPSNQGKSERFQSIQGAQKRNDFNIISQTEMLNDDDKVKNIILKNSRKSKIFSGQLYQLPVPDVTNYIYNQPKTLSPTNSSPKNFKVFNLQHSTASNSLDTNQNTQYTKAVIPSTESQNVERPEKFIVSTQKQNQLNQSNESLDFNNNFINSEDGISAHVQDNVIGTIPHPIEKDTFLTYKKGQSYLIFSKFDDDIIGNSQQNAPEEYKIDDRNAQPSQQTNTNGDTTVQFVPSVSFEVEDEKEQENIFNIFKIDTSFTNNTQVSNEDQASNGYPKETPSSPGKAIEAESLSEQSTTPKASEEQSSPNTLYAGPSSYSAPQASVGNLEAKQEDEEKKSSSTPEPPSSGYAKRSLIHIYSF